MNMKIKILLTAVAVASGLIACSGGDDCQPVSHAYQYCQDGILYWVDSCGDFEEIAEQCGCGCTADHQACDPSCSCQPDCAGKCCGDDGCGGQCSDACAQTGQSCNTATCLCEGSCQPQTCNDRGFECGTWPGGDGCGGTLNCGNCPAGEECGGDGQCFAIGCPGGLTLCDDMCVDTVEDARYCGDCETRCQAGEVCENSQCVEAPNCNQTPCTGFAYCDLATGNCLPGCISDSQCPTADEECNTATHSCECNSGFNRCDGACYIATDIHHCGVDCLSCAVDPFGTTICSNNQCSISCDSGYLFCAAACAACPSQGVVTTACSGAACVATSCTSGYELCGGDCASCPSQGVADTGCSGNQCVATACTSGYELCGGACATCPTVGVADTGCSGDQCVATACSSGYRLCGGGCSTCPTGPQIVQTGCVGDQCVATECALGYYPDGSGCTAFVSHYIEQNWDRRTYDISLGVGPNGLPQLAYHVETYNDLKVAKSAANWAWSKETVAGDNYTDVGLHPDLVVDSQNQAHVVYYDAGDDRLTYVRYNAGTQRWIFEQIFTFSHSFWEDDAAASIELDSAGNPHVCFHDVYDEVVYYAKRTVSGWSTPSVIANADASSVSPCSLAIGSDGRPRVLYLSRDILAGNYSMHFATFNGSSWQTETLRNSHATITQRSLALNADDEPQVLYADGANRLYLMGKTGTQWNASLISNTETIPYEVRVDSLGEAHVLWSDVYGTHYSRRAWSTWIHATLLDAWPNTGSMVLDASDHVHMVLVYDENFDTQIVHWH